MPAALPLSVINCLRGVCAPFEVDTKLLRQSILDDNMFSIHRGQVYQVAVLVFHGFPSTLSFECERLANSLERVPNPLLSKQFGALP